MIKIKSNQKKSAFLLKTYDILENSNYLDIIQWHHDGIGFVINNIEKFTDDILPIYFKHSNFASFIRQLNMYGFSKKRATKSENYYFHQKFRKNQKQLISQIQRKIQKKTLKNINKHNQQNQEIKISSQLSIQLQYKNQSIKTNTKDKILSQFNKLSVINYSLINSQYSIISQMMKDIQFLKHTQLSQKQQIQIKTVLQQYIQAQNMFLAHQKLKQYAHNNYLQTCLSKSLSRLQTSQTLKQRKQVQKIMQLKQKSKKFEDQGRGSNQQQNS